MGLNNNLGTLVHRLDNADFTANVYFKAYASVDTTVVINGTSMLLKAGVVLENVVFTTLTSAAPTNVTLIGDPKPYNSKLPFNINTGISFSG